MLVTTFSGQIFEITSAGGAITTPLASTGEDTEGMDIAPSTWGPYAGQLLVSSEGSGELRFISPTGVVTLLRDSSGAPIIVPSAETVSFVPLNLGISGNPLEGFYVANYPVNIQKAPASDFAGLQGDAIITSEDSFNARVSGPDIRLAHEQLLAGSNADWESSESIGRRDLRDRTAAQ